MSWRLRSADFDFMLDMKKGGRINSAVECIITGNSCSALGSNCNRGEMAGISGSDEEKRRAAEIRGRKEKSQQRAEREVTE